MPVIIAEALALAETFETTADNPVIGWENLVTTSNVIATDEDADFPATNLANPSTALKWAGASVPTEDVYLTVILDEVEPVDYAGLARHNFGTAGIVVSIEGLSEEGSPDAWEELVEEYLPADDSPILSRFTSQSLSQIRVRLQPGSAAPSLAVLHVGELLVMERRLYVGHGPGRLNRRADVLNGVSENGNFLGQIVRRQTTETSVSMPNLTPAWVRNYFDPFAAQSRGTAFFWAWRPGDYPREVEYAWLTGDISVTNILANGMMQVEIPMRGIRT